MQDQKHLPDFGIAYPLSKQSESSIINEPPQQQTPHFKVLVNYDELSEKLAELHHKDIKNFWLSGRIEDGRLVDMMLTRVGDNLVA